jgi:1-acyl-sn-glycerol-3-phosphate acyltransferase
VSDLKTIAKGWRWFRPSPRPKHIPPPPLKTEASFETDWARRPWANRTRDYVQELVLLPALRYLASPTTRGRERLRNVSQPAVIAANHVSHLDTSVVVEAMPQAWRHRLAVGAAADYFFKGKVRGALAALVIGAFPVERKRASAVSARLAVDLVNQGWNLILFPEGGRSEDGWLQEMKPGAAFVAARTGRPLVPLWITGTEHLLPKGAKKLRRGHVDVLIGDPLYPREGEGPRELHARFEEAMHKLAAEATTDWWSALRGAEANPYGPDAARWRRVWARAERPGRRRSDWD